ncbi:hypothetical protein C8R45DRAFT_567059 [Mycena sanguinolenta]|nr:hypothetical protein C8R45DRAFT_567059 [Mycena sanguinolenta]
MPTQILIYEALISYLRDACDVGIPRRSPSEVAQLHAALDAFHGVGQHCKWDRRARGVPENAVEGLILASWRPCYPPTLVSRVPVRVTSERPFAGMENELPPCWCPFSRLNLWKRPCSASKYYHMQTSAYYWPNCMGIKQHGLRLVAHRVGYVRCVPRAPYHRT